jgi:hypothetical protein
LAQVEPLNRMSNIAPFDPRRRRSSWHKRRVSSSRPSSGFGLGKAGGLVLIAVIGSGLFYVYALTRSGSPVAAPLPQLCIHYLP